MDKTKYFEDADYPDVIVRKQPDMLELEVISKFNPVWRKTEPESSYEREYYFGEGRGCLFEITREDAEKRLSVWGVGMQNGT